MKLILSREVNEVSCALVSVTEWDTVNEKRKKVKTVREWERVKFMNSVRSEKNMLQMYC